MGGPGAARYPPREARFASVRTIREAHRLHAEGMSVEQAAIATISRTRYQDVGGYCETLRSTWAHLGLPVRPRRIAQILRARTEPPGARPKTRPNYRHDVDTRDLAAHYLETGSTIATGAAFGLSQQAVWSRLKPLGVIIAPRDRKRATIERAARKV